MSALNPLLDDERRKGPDLLITVLRWLAVTGWILVVLFLIIAGIAKPEFQSYFGERYHAQFRSNWDLDVLLYSYYLMAAVLGISVSGVLLNILRHRRKNDEYMISFFVMGFTSLAGILIYLFSFG